MLGYTLKNHFVFVFIRLIVFGGVSFVPDGKQQVLRIQSPFRDGSLKPYQL